MTSSCGILLANPRRVIGVAGGTGSGKTTIVRRLVESLGPDNVTLLEQDRYYRDLSAMRPDYGEGCGLIHTCIP
jgi:uridine kinase